MAHVSDLTPHLRWLPHFRCLFRYINSPFGLVGTEILFSFFLLSRLLAAVSPYNKTSDVFSPEYKANTSRRIGFSADVITNTLLNIRLFTAFAMHVVGIYSNIT